MRLSVSRGEDKIFEDVNVGVNNPPKEMPGEQTISMSRYYDDAVDKNIWQVLVAALPAGCEAKLYDDRKEICWHLKGFKLLKAGNNGEEQQNFTFVFVDAKSEKVTLPPPRKAKKKRSFQPWEEQNFDVEDNDDGN